MNYERLHFIINPASGGGSAGKVWAQARGYIESVLGAFSYEFTGQKGHAIELAKRASGRSEKIIGIGGDGTISEIVTGVLQSGQNSAIGVLNLGTGGDLCRSLGIRSNMSQGLKRLQNGVPKPMDVGRVTFQTLNQSQEIRYFMNITGCGMAGEVVRTINRSRKLFGSFSYYISSVQNLLSYKNKNIKIYLDDAVEPLHFKVVTVAVANGRYFGGGMQVAPGAKLDDGLFHVTVIGDWNLFEKVLYSSRLYGRKFLKTPGVHSFEAKKIRIEPEEGETSVYIDSDGEDIGMIPMTVEILPSSIQLIL